MQRLLSMFLITAPCCVATFLVAEGEAFACHTSRVCVEFEVSAVDSDTGDYGAASTVRARGTRAMLVTPDEEGAWDTFLDDEGCVTFDTRHTTALKLLVYPDTYLGIDDNVHIQSFAGFSDATADPPIPTKPWLIDLLYVPIDNVDDPTIAPPIKGKIANMHGWAIESFYNIDTYGEIQGELDMLVHTEEGDPSAALGGYASGNRIMLGPIARERKFIVAHEIAHWYQGRYIPGLSVPAAYGYERESGDLDDFSDAKDPDCDFRNAVDTMQINDSHGIRSAEWAPSAMGEGFAQFVSALAFNDPNDGDGEFQYYKDIIVANQPSYDDFVNEDFYIVDLIGGPTASGGTNAWVMNMCQADWDTPLELTVPPNGIDDPRFGIHVGTEMDWLRFFWEFMADPDVSLPNSGDLPNLFTIMRVFEAAGTLFGDDIYATFQAAIDDPQNVEIYPYRDRFAAVAVKNGVHTNE